ncbi:MAG: hypothetical protein JO056_09005 [Alphaproteobacteria bacterium]|nr:hypothetical protein [Alphaproteobacteria bacterium]
MTAAHLGAGLLAGLLAGIAGAAVASNFAPTPTSGFFAAGNHRFYVWCAASPGYLATQSGRDAEDAQLRLYNSNKARGKATCWPIWQGRLPG